MKKKSGKKKSGSKKKNGSKKLWIGLVVCALAIIAIAAGIILRNMRNGWKEMDGVTKYLKNGKEVTGINTIDGTQYIFDESGQLYIGWFLYEGKT